MPATTTSAQFGSFSGLQVRSKSPAISLMNKLILLLIIPTLLFSSCMTPEAEMKPWVGLSSSQLIGQWGPPQYKNPDNKGGQIWIYQQQRSYATTARSHSTLDGNGRENGTLNYGPFATATYTGNSSYQGTATTSYTPSQSYTRTQTRSFYIDRNGMIYAVNWGGN